MSRTPKPRRYRRHADAPANWHFRDGRPRWIPSPTLRKAGWKGRDLKDPAGAWLTEGASRDAARDINAAVDAWRRADPVPAAFAAIAPEGAVEPGQGALPRSMDPLAIGRLLDAYQGSREFLALKPSTQRGYRTSLKRLIDTLAGWVVLPERGDEAARARYAHAVATVRASGVHILEPAEHHGRGVVDVLYNAYWSLHDRAGKHQAYAVMAAASAWLTWSRRHQSRTIHNWAKEVRRDTPPGRVNPWTPEQFKHMVATADRMGLRSIADAMVLGLDLSWSQVDRTALTWDRLKHGRAITGGVAGDGGRAKTGRVGGTPLTSLGRARVAAIRTRQRAMAAQPTHVLISEATGAPYEPDGSHYRKQFQKVRAEAAKTMPGCALIRDQDLRDTAFTWMKNAGIDDDGIASRTLQSRRHISDLADAHYGEIGPAIADPAAAKYDAYLRSIDVA